MIWLEAFESSGDLRERRAEFLRRQLVHGLTILFDNLEKPRRGAGATIAAGRACLYHLLLARQNFIRRQAIQSDTASKPCTQLELPGERLATHFAAGGEEGTARVFGDATNFLRRQTCSFLQHVSNSMGNLPCRHRTIGLSHAGIAQLACPMQASHNWPVCWPS
jgi:hypothetical protein